MAWPRFRRTPELKAWAPGVLVFVQLTWAVSVIFKKSRNNVVCLFGIGVKHNIHTQLTFLWKRFV